MALRTQDQGDSQVLYNNREWKVTMLRQAKTPAALKAFFSGDWHQDLWHLGATRGMYGTSLCLELTYTWDQRGIPDSGQCPVEISSQRLMKSSAGLFADTTNGNVEQYKELLWRLRWLEPYGQMLFSKWKVNRHVTLKPLPLLDIEVQQRG